MDYQGKRKTLGLVKNGCALTKRTGSKNIDCGMKRFLSDENDVKMLPQTLEKWVPNL